MTLEQWLESDTPIWHGARVPERRVPEVNQITWWWDNETHTPWDVWILEDGTAVTLCPDP